MGQTDSRVILKVAESQILRTFLQVIRFALVAVILYLVVVDVAQHYTVLLQSQNLLGHQGDYGIFAEMGRTIVNGRRLYVDFFSGMAPGVPLMLTPFIATFGPTVLAVNLEAITIFIIFGFASTALAYALTGSKASALGAEAIALLYTTFQNGPETVFTMMTLGTVAAWCAVQGRGRPVWMLCAGASFAFGALAKQPLVFELPILLLLVTWRSPERQRPRALFFTLVGGAIVFLAVMAWTISQGILEAMLFRTIRMMSQYVTGNDGLWHFGEESPELFKHYFLNLTLIYLRPLLLGAALSIAATLITKTHRRTLAVLMIWFCWSFIIASIPRGWRADYFMQTLPSLIAMIAVGLSYISRLDSVRQVAAIGLLLVALFASNLLTLSALNGEVPATMPEENTVLVTIEAQTTKDDCLWMWGSISYLNYLSERDSCAGAAIEGFTMDSNNFPIVSLRIEYMQQLFQRLPTLHVKQDTWGYFPQLQDFADRYLSTLILETENYAVYTIDHSMWHAADANFGNEIRLVGYDLLPVEGPYCPGDTLTLAMTWQQMDTPTHQYQMFVQVLTSDEQGRVAAYDGPPEDDDDDNATNTWVDVGEFRLGERFDLRIEANAAPGPYKLVVGLYDVASMERVPVLNASGAQVGSYVVLQPVEVSDCR